MTSLYNDVLYESYIISYGNKVVTASEAASKISNGSRIFIGSGCGEPQQLIHAMVRDENLQDIMIYQMLSYTLAKYFPEPHFFKRFSIKLFFVTIPMQQAALEGKIDYIPTYLSQIPNFFRNNLITIDTALIQISPPDRFGVASLGVSVDVTLEAIKHAKTIIAQVNPRMPRTHGDGFIHVNDIDYLVPFEEELLINSPDSIDETISSRIAQYVKELVDDGSTLQVGYGYLPYTLLRYFDDKNDLGIHTHMISDEFISLFEKGVINNKKKNFMTGRAVATFCMGSRIAYDYIDNNIQFYFGTADFVNTPAIIGRNDNFVSIISGLEVDLTGQVCSDSVGRQFFSGTGDQVNFIRGANLSKGGISIIAIPSTAVNDKNEMISRIVPTLRNGAGVGTLRSDVNFVVTEYGIAQLKGKSIYQRVIELTQIAHPDFREELIDAAKKNRYIFKDQMPLPAEDLIFLEAYKSRIKLGSGKIMSVRPLLPSDEIAYRNFFYSLKQETVFLRFFHSITIFSRKMAQEHWANMDYRNFISLVGRVRNKANNEIMAIGTYAEFEPQWAEVAFVVREDFQGQGIAGYLLKELEKIAIKNGYKGFYAMVLSENESMIHVFKKHYPEIKISMAGEEIELRMPFERTIRS
ncbi:Acetyl-CoA hydrolase/transferase [Desulfamplus magnetovallimortis]|uniref:Acetyl-CoA hydrolase/transferase n=1 Tax=Desulfamplus magnetovallimortis TaxID=1246637 RepID=A0A1W1HJI9_9BACT|nr:bifunctional acetyl-CoA hydrolase/transferase family protein/GNAT family N-acetyltransferase [Desulfamplus magnetovallimortis]SLM32575.1 Acetyl-CoA hydrolase/transferase [Desulfamplus magnetovallimortis]